MGGIDRVEFRIDGGEWRETTYSSELEDLGPLTPFLWHVILDPSKIDKGPHMVEIRAVSGDSVSLPVIVTVNGTSAVSAEFSVPPLVIALVATVFIIWAASVVLVRIRSDGEINDFISRLLGTKSVDFVPAGVIDAELLEEDGKK